jgi:hypothetical protein
MLTLRLFGHHRRTDVAGDPTILIHPGPWRQPRWSADTAICDWDDGHLFPRRGEIRSGTAPIVREAVTMHSSDPWRAVFALARAQHGILAIRQTVALGIPRSSVEDRARREGWERPFRGVVLIPGCPIEPRVLARAAALARGGDTTITGPSALHLRGCLDEPPARIHLVVPHASSVTRHDLIRVARSRTLRDDHRTFDAGVWIATPARAFLDASRRFGRERLRSWLIDARQRRVVTVPDVVALASSLPSVPGRGRLLAACADVDASGADSVLVAEVERRLRQKGFVLDVPPRTVQTPGRALHPDVTVAGVPVGIEVDGFGTHSDRQALDLDQRKHNAYVLAGWVVLRIGWTRMERDWEGFVAELCHAIARCRGAGPASG